MSRKSTAGYGQYCPLALAAELLCRRWTVLVLSRLIDGCRTFNEIHKGVPKISPSLLSARLKELAHAGLVRQTSRAPRPTYELTDAGRAAEQIVDAMAVWGQQWARDMEMEDLDPAFLAWSMHTRINHDAMPEERIVMEFEFTGVADHFNRFWLVSDAGKIDMCLKHPGFDADLRIQSDLRVFVEAWRGFRDLETEIRRKRILLTGPKHLRQALPGWLLLSGLAPFERSAPGRERSLARRYVD